MKTLLTGLSFFFFLQTSAQTCYTLGPRNNGNGQSNTCGSPNCSGNAKTGHFDVVFAALPSPLPTMELLSVSTPPIPSPFCFDPGSLQSGTTVRYCFRGTNLPSSGSMVIRFTQGASVWSCSYNVDGSGGTVLPVKLVSFTAKLEQNAVQLKWQTAQEINNDRFDIEQSSDNQNFKVIGTVRGSGNSNIPVDYNFTDLSPAKGVSFYRIKQVDVNGKADYSAIKKIDNRIAGIQLKQLFPNPSHEVITLDVVTDSPVLLSACIFNIAGKKVYHAEKRMMAGETYWPLRYNHLSPGIYELVVKNDKGGSLTEKILVQ